MIPSPVVVTGASGRLGRALIDEMRERGTPAVPWSRPKYDLDDPRAAARAMEHDQPRLVIHCAAWTNVDGCAAQPGLAMRRNGAATGELATECARRGMGFVLVSTNEVFDGTRTDGRGYAEDDPTNPINPYGASKAAGEAAATSAYATADAVHLLWIVRTAWLFGPPGNDFPSKIIAKADGMAPGERLRVVADEIGSPTYSHDLASALLDLVRAAPGGVYHLAGGGAVSRHAWAQAVVDACRPGLAVEPISSADFTRASRAPAWSVLDSRRAAGHGLHLRPWPDALDEYLRTLC